MVSAVYGWEKDTDELEARLTAQRGTKAANPPPPAPAAGSPSQPLARWTSSGWISPRTRWRRRREQWRCWGFLGRARGTLGPPPPPRPSPPLHLQVPNTKFAEVGGEVLECGRRFDKLVGMLPNGLLPKRTLTVLGSVFGFGDFTVRVGQ